ncbi:MAG: DUF2059 domain-containing protein [Hyphomicrobium sp.]
MNTVMRVAFLAIAMSCGSAVGAPLSAQEAAAVATTTTVDPERLAAARDMLEVTGVTRQLDGMMDAMKKGFASGAEAETSESGKRLSAEFDSSMKKFMDYKQDMLKDFEVLYAETFTAEEMKTIADFYRSGTGAKFISLTPELMQKGSVIGMKYSQKVIESIKADRAAPKP